MSIIEIQNPAVLQFVFSHPELEGPQDQGSLH